MKGQSTKKKPATKRKRSTALSRYENDIKEGNSAGLRPGQIAQEIIDKYELPPSAIHVSLCITLLAY
jgi:hypothetical protein